MLEAYDKSSKSYLYNTVNIVTVQLDTAILTQSELVKCHLDFLLHYFSNKHHFSPFVVYPNPTSTGILMILLNFGSNNALHKNLNLGETPWMKMLIYSYLTLKVISDCKIMLPNNQRVCKLQSVSLICNDM